MDLLQLYTPLHFLLLLFYVSLLLSLLFSSAVSLPGWFLSVLSSRTVCMCVYLVCIGGTEPWPLPIFFTQGKYALGQMEK